MAAPQSLIEGSRAFARDFARDRMPQGYLWDMADWVPNLLDSELTSRGGWIWGSTAIGGDVIAGKYAPYKSGDRLMLIGSNAQLYDIGLTMPHTATAKGAMPVAAQNPVQHRDWVFSFDQSQATAPRVITHNGTDYTIATMSDATAPKARFGAVYKDRLVVANLPGQEQQVRFSYPGFILKDDPNTGNPLTMKWDANSFINTSLAVTGITAMRSMILVFHAGSVERIRGSIPPGTDIASDMFLESLFDRAGCTDARSIAHWNDNCIFADERGIHLTDGSIVRNLISQAGLLYFWRTLYRAKLTLAAEVYLDYYILTVRRSDGVPPVTLVVDLNRRSIFRFTNIDATCYIQSIGAQEKLWAGIGTADRLAELSSCFFPVFTTTANADADGAPVLPSFETPWYRLGEEGRKRVRHAYLSYDVRLPGTAVAAQWRDVDGMDPDAAPPAPALAAIGTPIIGVEYIKGPQETAWLAAGNLPSSTTYRRQRLPVGKQPYGVAFRVKQLVPSSVTRVFDLGVEHWPSERSRL
jgi:hypothetical protein